MLIFSGTIARAASVQHFSATRVAEQTKTATGWSALTGAAGLNTFASTNGWIDNSNFTVGTRYLLLVWGYHNTNDNTGRSGLRVTHGGTSFSESEGVEETDRTSASYKTPYFWFTVWTAADEDIEVEYYNASAVTARAEDVTLIAMNVESLITNNDLKYTIETAGGALTTTFAAKSTLTWTPANNNDTWWIMGYTRADINTITGDAYSAQLHIDSTLLTAQVFDGENLNDTPIYGLGWAQTLSNASHTISLDIRETVGDQDWLAAGVLALRLNYFDGFEINTTAAAQTLSAGVNNYNQIASIAKTVSNSSANWLIAAGCIVDDNNARTTARLQLNNTTNITDENGGWQPATTDLIPFTAAAVQIFGGDNSYTIDLDARETNSATDPVTYHSWLITFPMGPVRDRTLTAQE